MKANSIGTSLSDVDFRTINNSLWAWASPLISDEQMTALLVLLFCFAFVAANEFHHHDPSNPLHDTSSPEFKRIAAETYAKVLPCVTSAWMYKDRKVEFAFPDDALEHFNEIKKRTANYRTGPVHEYAGYSGPWMENIFINRYLNASLHSFRGLIPLYVQWIDFQILRGRYFDYILEELDGILRPNVLYLAISQGDVGLGKIGIKHPNILTMAAGGFGHIPMPLIKGEIPVSPQPDKFEQDIGFFGTASQSTRPEMLSTIKSTAESLHMTYRQGAGASWKHDMESTKFNLAPRGYGRSSFRFAESVQMGRVPVFLYNDLHWVPYYGSNASVERYGFLAGSTAHENTLKEMVHALHNLTEAEYQTKLLHLREVRSHFTYEGMYHQMELFLRDPFGPNGGDLRCTRHPNTERCCG